MGCAVKGLPRERLLVERAVRVAVKEAADFVLKLMDAGDGGFDQPPRHILMRQPFSALNRVHEMPLNRIAGIEGDVVSALHHPRAAAFPDKAFDRQRDLSVRRGLLRVEGGK